MMDVVILAGGFGTRLQAMVPDLPKPMAPVGGRPFLELLLRSMSRQRVAGVILSVGYKAEAISGYFGERFEGMELSYVVEDVPLGTGGAVRQALTMCHADHALVVNGDSYVDLEIDQLEARWQTEQLPLIVAQEVQDTARFGRLETENERVVRFSEKAVVGRGLINVGCYVFPKQLLDSFRMGETFSLEQDFLMEAVQRQPFGLYVTNGRFIDIGIPEDYARAQELLADL